MKLQTKILLLFLLMVFLIAALEAQVPCRNSPSLTISDKDDLTSHGIRTDLIVSIVSIQSNKKGCLRYLTDKNFEIYDENEKQEIVIFGFDKSTDKYYIGFYPKVFNLLDDKWHNVKIKLKLPKEKKKDYGKISVKAQKGYYPKNPKSKV